MISAALVAALVGYGASIAIVLAAAQAVGATPAQTASWVAAVSVAKGLGSAGLSLWTRVPMVLAWSTPGAALIAATTGIDMAQAAGAFVLAGALLLLTGLIPSLGRLVAAIPAAVAAAMLAGVLLPFVMAVPAHAAATPLRALPVAAVFLLTRLRWPAFAALAALGAALALGFGSGAAIWPQITPVAQPFVLVMPAFDPQVLIGLGLPLYLVTMAAQNLPGFAVLRANGYTPPVAPALLVTGAGSMLTALAGGHSFNMAAITAALCLGEDVDPDPATRWRVGLVYGAIWVVIGWLGWLILPIILVLPPALIATVAGLALIPALTGALVQGFEPPATRFAAAATLAVTASGISALGIGAAFWGLAAGLTVLALDRLAARR